MSSRTATSLTITFPAGTYEGLKRVATQRWPGSCFVVSRDDLDSDVTSVQLNRPGVYVLDGWDEEAQPAKRRVYVGQAHALSDRLRNYKNSHSKSFWRTAFAFTGREGFEIDGAFRDYLESSLIAYAAASSEAAYANKNRGMVSEPPPNSRLEWEEELAWILDILAAFGLNLRTPPETDDDAGSEEIQTAETKTILLALLPEVEALREEIRVACESLPGTTFYNTKYDWRARVGTGRLQVYLRAAPRSTGFYLKFSGGPKVLAQAGMPFALRDDLQRAYDFVVNGGRS